MSKFTQTHPFRVVAPSGETVYFSNLKLAVAHVIEFSDIGWAESTITDLWSQRSYTQREIQSLYIGGRNKVAK